MARRPVEAARQRAAGWRRAGSRGSTERVAGTSRRCRECVVQAQEGAEKEVRERDDEEKEMRMFLGEVSGMKCKKEWNGGGMLYEEWRAGCLEIVR